MSTDVKLRKTQLSKIIQSGRFLGKTLGKVISNLSKKEPTDLPLPLTKAALPKLATKAGPPSLDKFEREISGQGAVRAGKGLTLFISNEDMDDMSH